MFLFDLGHRTPSASMREGEAVMRSSATAPRSASATSMLMNPAHTPSHAIGSVRPMSPAAG